MEKRNFLLLFLLLLLSCSHWREKESTQAQGKLLYNAHCATCHGEDGKGEGPLAPHLFPKPRDLTSGIFKYRTTQGDIPDDVDILQTMKMGVPGTPMPGWDLLGTPEWKSILAYVKSLSPKLQNQKAGPLIEIPSEPKSTQNTITAGRAIYKETGCVHCHGIAGKGDGQASMTLKDMWGEPVLPRDLTHGPLKWGNANRDIYRTLAVGIPGVPMPSYERTLSPEQIWNLVHYLKFIQKMPKDFNPSNPKRNLIPLEKISGILPDDFGAAAWQNIKEVPIFLKPLRAERGMVEWLTVKAAHNTEEALFYIRWENTSSQKADSIAMQFPGKEVESPAKLPFLGMGSPANPVEIIRWQSSGMEWIEATGLLNPTVKKDPTPLNITGKGIYQEGSWHVWIRLPMEFVKNKNYLSFGLWNGNLESHPGPHTFSEWMVYELE